MEKRKLNIIWLKSLAIGLLFGGLYSFPFVYYQFMGFVVTILCAILILRFYISNQHFLLWICVLIAIIFNPIAPLHLRNDVWQILDIVTGLFFISTLWSAN